MRDRVERSARQWQRERESAEQYNGIKYVCKCWSETLYCGFALRTYSASSFNIIITITIRYTSYTFDFSLIVLFRFVFLCVRLTASFWRLCPTNQLVSMSKLFSLSLSRLHWCGEWLFFSRARLPFIKLRSCRFPHCFCFCIIFDRHGFIRWFSFFSTSLKIIIQSELTINMNFGTYVCSCIMCELCLGTAQTGGTHRIASSVRLPVWEHQTCLISSVEAKSNPFKLLYLYVANAV